jgi:N-acetylglutamate synthase-like GNAT family acetyltransferase
MEIKEIDDHAGLLTFYLRHGVHTDRFFAPPVFSLEMLDNDVLVGASTVSSTDKKFFILEAIAVEQAYQRKGYGSDLLETTLEKVRSIGGEELYIMSKEPNFFTNKGFKFADDKNVPNISICNECRENKKSCFPKAMKYVFKSAGDKTDDTVDKNV